ncbi:MULTISPECIES: hypothetical protein [Arthrobacter]|uniref:Uncharacterized protein n=1 Tax=Arthrobacter caoxuetaonis TaxID=2886935 RepID=A0A9X1MD64_9MICC|nr:MULTISPECIES: hypothetical protein [Arthrobacter]MCC3282236.1 hypothetical protein [Arthrobacter caoxuetaonis]MCC3297376.1 hypothetical protein [Arthrobacter caoxuetaonis]MCC9194266.1 hypothetical protein [Arthrobacter sp. zg-Y916]USQ58088.1 hypothetical protein NF551_04320 [Arthrobacter caoxuetaonis]
MNNDGPPLQARPPFPPATRKPEPTEAQSKEARSYLWVFIALLTGMLLSSELALPWKLLPLALGIAAMVVGIMTMVKIVRYGMHRMLRVIVSMGLAATAFMTLGLAAMVALWPMTARYEACMQSALTVQATESCIKDYTSFGGMLPQP